MRDTSDRPAAPNFTGACIVMFGINLVWVMVVIWAVWGFIAAAGAGLVLHYLIDRIAAARV